MKHLHTTLTLLLLLGATVGLRAESYLRAGAGHFAYTKSAYEDQGGATLREAADSTMPTRQDLGNLSTRGFTLSLTGRL